MIIYRQKEFASTKESRKKSKEKNEKDKTRKVINAAQGATAIGALGTAIGTGVATNKAKKKLAEQAKKRGVSYDGFLIHGSPKGVKAVEKLDRRITKNARKGNMVSLGLTGASLGLGIAKHTRDAKKAKEEKKEIVLDSRAPKKMKGKESKSDLLKLKK